MTLAEKIGQMTQVDQSFLKDPSDIERYNLGSILNGGSSDPAAGNSLQAWRAMVETYQGHAMRTRLRIPLIYGVDAVHGNNNVIGAVIFPHNIGLGATRDPALVQTHRGNHRRRNARRSVPTGRSLRASVFRRTFAGDAPTKASAKTPSSSRRLAPRPSRGLQGGSPIDRVHVAATAKHFAGDGGTSVGSGIDKRLDQGDTRVDSATLRRIHIRPYIDAIAAGVATIMPSYNSWNGVKVSGDRHLLTDVLKGELGFKGFLISDYKAVNQVHADYKTAIGISINAGMDMVMVPDRYVEFIELLTQLVQEGRVPMSRIDDAVTRILRVKFALGLMEPAYDYPRRSLARATLRFCGAPCRRATGRSRIDGAVEERTRRVAALEKRASHSRRRKERRRHRHPVRRMDDLVAGRGRQHHHRRHHDSLGHSRGRRPCDAGHLLR